MTRQIGYKKENNPTKKAAPKPPAKPKTSVVKKEKAEIVPEDRFAKTRVLIAWIKAHPMFAWGRMCVLLNINKGNFGQTLNSEMFILSKENIEKIEHVISDYGYEK